ncbi:uncharacterized protein A4U43_C02F21110 [Asparagus officinalis]|uniref:Uncharacterized protein n=1 Tax=Asparagus officinalis TaxID=4686 RepID=A0A5P1FNX4_ASPOF|nr:uncharacterized protein A4U43_C02F21110 [Asparagus officinalis]
MIKFLRRLPAPASPAPPPAPQPPHPQAAAHVSIAPTGSTADLGPEHHRRRGSTESRAGVGERPAHPSDEPLHQLQCAEEGQHTVLPPRGLVLQLPPRGPGQPLLPRLLADHAVPELERGAKVTYMPLYLARNYHYAIETLPSFVTRSFFPSSAEGFNLWP